MRKDTKTGSTKEKQNAKRNGRSMNMKCLDSTVKKA